MNESPTPKKSFDIHKGLDLMIKVGSKITKKSWGNPDEYCFKGDDGHLKIHKSDGKVHDWVLIDGDFIGEDYYTI